MVEYSSGQNAQSITSKTISLKAHNNDTLKGRTEGIKARVRWQLLARAVSRDKAEDSNNNNNNNNDEIRNRLTYMSLFSQSYVGDNWSLYRCLDNAYSLQVLCEPCNLDTTILIGFNNTGNIRIWPSEETMAVYILSNLSKYNDKTVLELGGGMSSLAGLFLAKYGSTKSVTVSDGNTKCVKNNLNIIQRNELNDKVNCIHLNWSDLDNSQTEMCYSVILIADCVFFDETRLDLINCIWLLLSDDGVAYVMAPKRHDSLDIFIAQAKHKGFFCESIENYNNLVWENHLKCCKYAESYEPNENYPILTILTKMGSFS